MAFMGPTASTRLLLLVADGGRKAVHVVNVKISGEHVGEVVHHSPKPLAYAQFLFCGWGKVGELP